MKKKIVIIGGVAAGMSAAAKARRTDPDADIRVYTDGEHISYAGCGLPYFIGGKIASEASLFARTVPDFAKQGITVKILSHAQEVRPEQGTVRIRDLAGGTTCEERYDRLIFATGARAFLPRMEGADLDGVFSLRTVRDGLRIKTFLRTHRPERVAIIGGGYIALEMAENFADLDCRVSIVERGSHIIPNMDEDMALVMQRYLESKGIAVHAGRAVQGFFGKKTVMGVHTDKGDIPADFVLLAIGVVPNSELAASVGIELGVKNAIRVNERAETNLAGIYAAGDCATVTHLLTEKETYIPLGTTANKQGKAAGENAAGGSAVFRGVIGTGIARALEMEVSRTGLTEKECQTAGIAYLARRIRADTAAHYCPASKEIQLKLVAEEKSHRLLGAQIVGYAGAAMRIDMLATAITVGATVERLLDMDLAYSPPFSPVWDPVLVALNQF